MLSRFGRLRDTINFHNEHWTLKIICEVILNEQAESVRNFQLVSTRTQLIVIDKPVDNIKNSTIQQNFVTIRKN